MHREIKTDALDYVVGIVLTQHGHPMAYHSEALSYTIRKYPTYDKRNVLHCASLPLMETLHSWEGDSHPH